MNRLSFLLGAALLVWTAPHQTPRFRSTVNAVTIDVAVQAGNLPVADLKASDFLLTDDGVPQSIESVSVDAIPVDVSLVVDVSGSTASELENYRRDVVAIGGLLRPIDQLRLFSFDALTHLVSPLVAGGTKPNASGLHGGNFSAVYDGVVTALMQKTAPGRRHLIVMFSDGIENMSISTPEQMREVAKRSDAVLHLISPMKLVPLIDTPAGGPTLLEDAVLATGGRVHVGDSMVKDFKTVFKDFIRSYVLFFTPSGVPATGWHNVSVTVTRKGKFTVHAKRGYFAGQTN